MKLVGTIYEHNGRLWLLKREALPKTRGEYVYWIANGINISIGFFTIRARNKHELKTKIKEHATTIQ